MHISIIELNLPSRFKEGRHLIEDIWKDLENDDSIWDQVCRVDSVLTRIDMITHESMQCRNKGKREEMYEMCSGAGEWVTLTEFFIFRRVSHAFIDSFNNINYISTIC